MAECSRVCVEEGITGTVLKPLERRHGFAGDDCCVSSLFGYLDRRGVTGQRRHRLGSARLYKRYNFISVFYRFLLSETVFLILRFVSPCIIVQFK